MALLYCDSFDHFDFADSGAKWFATTSSPAFVTGRNGIGVTVFDVDSIQIAIPVVGDAYTVGFALRINGYGSTASRWFQFTFDGNAQCGLRSDGAGRFVAIVGSTAVATGTTIYNTATWLYVEIQVVIADAPNGVFILHVNGVEEINFSGDTRAFATTANANRMQFGTSAGANGTNITIDDLYLCDDLGGVNDDFLGDIKVECLFPNGNGNSSQLDGSDGNSTDNYLLVDEEPPDDDTTYVESPDVGDKDTYAFTNLATASGTVFGAQIVPYWRKTDAGSRTAVSVARHSGTEEDSAAKTLFDTWRYAPDMRNERPGGGAWTISDINGAEFGVKVDS